MAGDMVKGINKHATRVESNRVKSSVKEGSILEFVDAPEFNGT